MSEPVVLLLALSSVWAWLHYREKKTFRWALLVGVFAGWAAITRPPDALAWVLPFGLAMLVGLRGQTARRRIAVAATFVAGACPFLILQLIFNYGVTGNVLRTPHQEYAAVHYPHSSFGSADAGAVDESPSRLPQQRRYYKEFVAPAVKLHREQGLLGQWRDDRFLEMLLVSLCSPLLAVVLPACFIACWKRQRWIAIAPVGVFVIVYSFSTFFIQPYIVPIAPAVLFAVVLGARAVEEAWPKRCAWINTVLSVGLLVIGIGWLPGLVGGMQAESAEAPEMARIEKMLAGLEHKPAVVLFRARPNQDPHIEPVYNWTAAWPDDAEVIRAHDLGAERDQEIFDYYAKRQPERGVLSAMTGRPGEFSYLGTGGGTGAVH